jgi:putative membrane protein
MAADDSQQSLALQRTLLAHERTLMAWIRTSTSLISFGFSIYKFFAYLIESNRAVPERRIFGPREFAIAMISVGVVALILAVAQQRHALKLLNAQNNTEYSSLAGKIAAVIVLVGLFLLSLVLLRW